MNPGVVPTNEFYGDSDARSGEGQHSLLKLPDYRESFFSGSHGLPTENNGKPNHFMQKVEKISGLDNLEPVNDMILYRESEETGAILVRLGSDNMLEEDLSLISEEGFFTKEEIDNITRNAFADLLTRLGTYVDPDRLHYLFPGLDLEKVQEYNFADSRIRMFVLPSFVHQEIHTIIFDDHQFSGASYATTIRSHTKRKSEPSVEYVNISERTLIVMNETYVYEGIFQNKDIHPHGLKSTEKDIAEFYLYVGMIHEIIHKLGLFDDMNPSISEGMVELWANFVARDKYADRPEILEEAYITCYVSNTDALVILCLFCSMMVLT